MGIITKSFSRRVSDLCDALCAADVRRRLHHTSPAHFVHSVDLDQGTGHLPACCSLIFDAIAGKAYASYPFGFRSVQKKPECLISPAVIVLRWPQEARFVRDIHMERAIDRLEAVGVLTGKQRQQAKDVVKGFASRSFR